MNNTTALIGNIECRDLKKYLIILFFLSILFCTWGNVYAANNTTELISIANNGSQGNFGSYESSISQDGRFVAFSSCADNLVSNDSNNYQDIFVRDRLLNITERVSISFDGQESNGGSYYPSISADGRYVTFSSDANNLVLGDNNGLIDVFLRDRLLNTTLRVSFSENGEEANGGSDEPVISADGHYVAFSSESTNIVPNDENNVRDIFVYNIQSKTLKRASVSSSGIEGDGGSFNPSISADGSLVAFSSDADNLVAQDTNYCSDIFVFNQSSGLIKRVSVSNNGEQGDGGSYCPSINWDGSLIAFLSDSDNFVNDDTNFIRDVFVFDQESNTTELVRVIIDGEEVIDECGEPSISGDGRYVAFKLGRIGPSSRSVAKSNFNQYFNYSPQVYVFDRYNKISKVISESDGVLGNGASENPSLNEDGSVIAFCSVADNLVSGDNNFASDVFVYMNTEFPEILNGNIKPQIVKSGNSIVIWAYQSNATEVSALIMGETFKLSKQSENIWRYEYLVPTAQEGVYSVLLSSVDLKGDHQNLTLNFTVDNTSPIITASIDPHIFKSSDNFVLTASTDPDTISVTAWLDGTNELKMYEYGDGLWDLSCFIPYINEGLHTVLFQAIDFAGNRGMTSVSFYVDNTPPQINGWVVPYSVKTFDEVIVNAISDNDTSTITASILGKNYNLIKQSNGVWFLKYRVPYVTNGIYTIFLTATDFAGNSANGELNFSVENPSDNIAPVISATITPDVFFLIDGLYPLNSYITIFANSDPDTVSVVAIINGESFNMNRQDDGTWLLPYSVFSENGITLGIYPVLLIATDWSGNQGTQSLNFTVKDMLPVIEVNVTPTILKSGYTFNVNVTSFIDAQNVNAHFFGNDSKQLLESNGIWKCEYIVPDVASGSYHFIITLFYGIGVGYGGFHTLILEHVPFCITVDNTPPNISGSVSPDPIKSGDTLKLNVISDNAWGGGPDDTVNLSVTILGQTFDMVKLGNWEGWYWKDRFTSWGFDYVVPSLSDGVYQVYITATDIFNNQKTIVLNFTVDNTLPVITGSITPNRIAGIDFGDRTATLFARSSEDTKEVYAFLAGSWVKLKFINDNWIYTFSFPIIINLGDYMIPLHAIDKAGNVGTTEVYFTVFDSMGIKLNDQFGGSSNSGGSEGSSGGSEGTTGSGNGGNSGSSDGSGGSENPEEVDNPDDSNSYYDYLPWILLAILFILLFVLLVMVFPIIGFIIWELMYEVLVMFFSVESSGIIVLLYNVFIELTSLTSFWGFSLTAISLFLDTAVGNGAGLALGLIFLFVGFALEGLGVCLFGLILMMIMIFFTVRSIVESGHLFDSNRSKRHK